MPRASAKKKSGRVPAALNGYTSKVVAECAHKFVNDGTLDPALKDPWSMMMLALFAGGNDHEARVTDALHASVAACGFEVWIVTVGEGCEAQVAEMFDRIEKFTRQRRNKKRVWLAIETLTDENGKPQLAGKADHEALSNAALAAGIHGGDNWRLATPGRIGVLDHIQREDQRPGSITNPTYIVIDDKDHKALTGDRVWDEGFWVSGIDNPFYEAAEWYDDLTGVPHLVDSLQGAHYWHQLNDLGYAGERIFGVIGREMTVVWRDLDSKMYLTRGWDSFDEQREFDGSYMSPMEIYEIRAAEAVRLEEATYRFLKDPTVGRPTRPERKTACGECQWKTVCTEELVAERHISLLPGVTPQNSKVHYRSGITDQRDLALLHSGTARLISAKVNTTGVRAAALLRTPDTSIEAISRGKELNLLIAEGLRTAGDVVAFIDETTTRYADNGGSARLAQHIDQARVELSQHVYLARGVESVELPRAHFEEDHDIEDANGILYLSGNFSTARTRGGRRSKFVPFVDWTDSRDGMFEVFRAQCEYWDRRLDVAKRAKRSIAFYHYTEHEDRYWTHLADEFRRKRHGWSPDRMAEFLDSPQWVDMYPILSRQLLWPTENHSLKSLAKYARFVWDVEDPGGGNSIAVYQQAIDATPEEMEQAREWLLTYNCGDVEAQIHLREWVNGMLQRKLPRVEDLEVQWDRRRRANRPRHSVQAA